MSLTRSFLKSLGLEEDKVNSIIEAHSDTVTALNEKYSELETRYNGVKENADRLQEVQKELDDLKKDDFKSKFEAEKSAHEALIESVSAEKLRHAKEAAVRDYYAGKNIQGANLNIALRATPLEGIELDEDGKLKDSSGLDRLVEGDFKPLITRRTVSSGGSLAGRQEAVPSPSDVMNALIRGQ